MIVCTRKWLPLVALGATLLTHQAVGHTSLKNSLPAADSTLEQAPGEIVLEFTQAVTPVSVTLTGPGGLAPSVGDIVSGDARVTLPILAPLEAGNYAVNFRVLSGDAHPIDGSFAFSVAAAAPVPAATEPPGTPRKSPPVAAEAHEPAVELAKTGTSLLDAADRLARAGFVSVLLLAVGLVAFRLTIGLPPSVDGWAISVTRGSAIAGMLLTGIYAATTTMAMTGTAGIGIEQLSIIARSSIGTSLLLAAIGFGVLAITGGASRSAAVAAALLVLSRVVTGHPASQSPTVLLVPGMAVHIVAAGFWFASLWILLRAVRSEPTTDLAGLVSGFSRAAVWYVGALLVAGVAMAVVHLATIDALFSSAYGQTLGWKLGGVAALLLLAALNRFVFTPDIERRSRSGRLGASIRVEALVMIGVIAVSTILAATRPAAQ